MKIPAYTQGRPAIYAAFAIFGGVFTLAWQYLPFGTSISYFLKLSAAVNVSIIVMLVYLAICLLKTSKKAATEDEVVLASKGVIYSKSVTQAIINSLCPAGPEDTYVGMHHFVENKERPSPLSTAYAIRAVLACPAIINEVPLTKMLEYILVSKTPTGWHAASQQAARPEVTADIIRIICALEGKSEKYNASLIELAKQIKSDPLVIEYAYLASTILTAIALEKLYSNEISIVEQAIINGFKSQGEKSGYWCEILSVGMGKPTPSISSTSRCLIALHSNIDTRNRDSVKEIAQKALNWLHKQNSFPLQSQHITRQSNESTPDIIVPRDFTAALVVISACKWYELENSREIATKAFKVMMSHHSDGLWRWTDNKSPIWMNSIAIEAVNSFNCVMSKWVEKA